MNDDAPIVSHAASKEYRENVDRMTCAAPGCRRWKVGDADTCFDHARIFCAGKVCFLTQPNEVEKP